MFPCHSLDAGLTAAVFALCTYALQSQVRRTDGISGEERTWSYCYSSSGNEPTSHFEIGIGQIGLGPKPSCK
jgi:hypothetical protein